MVNNFAISKTKIKKFNGISKNANTIKFKDIFLYAKNIINISKTLIGGRVIALECENTPQLIALYMKHGLEKLPTKGESNSLITMLFNH